MKAAVKVNLCEGESRSLSCPSNYHLRIDSVFFGRKDLTTCPHSDIYTSNCPTPPGALKTVRHRCNGRNDCVFEAKSEILGDSCKETHKAASVTYTCQGKKMFVMDPENSAN